MTFILTCANLNVMANTMPSQLVSADPTLHHGGVFKPLEINETAMQAKVQEQKQSSPALVIPLKVGQNHSIRLLSNPTTGYSWRFTAYPQFMVNTLISHEYQKPQSNMVGTQGMEIFTFKAEKPGKTTYVFEYGKLWDPASYTNAQTFSIEVTQ